MSEQIAVEYIGEGTFEQGIPARNLTAAEWSQVPAETQKRLIANKIYKLVKTKKEGE